MDELKHRELVESYRAWVRLFPGNDKADAQVIEYSHQKNSETIKRVFTEPERYIGNCCEESHHQIVEKALFDKSGKVIRTEKEEIALPDSQVCARERAWRRYCTARDGVSHHIPEWVKH